MNHNQLTIGYHSVSTVGLSEAEAQEFVDLLSKSNIEAEALPYQERKAGLPTASIIPPPNNLIIKLEGVLASQPMLANIARDIYIYFEKNWKSIQKEKRVAHFAVIVDVTVNGARQQVGIDFQDDKTLAINCYRLAEYFTSPQSGHPSDSLVEFEYPKGQSFTILTFFYYMMWMLLVTNGWELITKGNLPAYWPWTLFKSDPQALNAYFIWLAIMLTLAVGLQISNRRRNKQYAVQFESNAYGWVKHINPASSFQSMPQINVQVVNNPAQFPETKIKPIKILFLASNPKDTARIRLDEEIRTIDEALQKSEYRDRFQLEKHFAVRVSDLQNHLLRYKPDIVHFSGHGSEKSEIILEDEQGKRKRVSQRAIGQLFKLLKDNIRCVILNACYLETQAKAIAEHIECVVGMSNAISDEAAIRFSKAFYQALGYGRDIKTAFDLGCLEIDTEGFGEQDTPKLIASREDPSAIYILQGIR